MDDRSEIIKTSAGGDSARDDNPAADNECARNHLPPWSILFILPCGMIGLVLHNYAVAVPLSAVGVFSIWMVSCSARLQPADRLWLCAVILSVAWLLAWFLVT